MRLVRPKAIRIESRRGNWIQWSPTRWCTDPGEGVAGDLGDRHQAILRVISRNQLEEGHAEATVKTHVGQILARAGRMDRVALVILAYASELVPASGDATG